ncbi:MAG: SIS domain-containing protein [Spirochaetales bacterium]|uniref:SIS domain-containing protein n=1 Tax=Candidatus Thalassospirochaeta sargassi TaxID=3119039 RepID=A0AAJ1MKM5_9SPIO|nr:SIS domain-containing protein [Spirochaetales bacterium]
MINIDETKLNNLELKVLKTLSKYSKDNQAPKITEAAALCACSVSQVSKSIKKAGFDGYKQYMRYLYYDDNPQKEIPEELVRIRQFVEEFDVSLADELAKLIISHKKIILFGFGPSFICAQYIEYKLRLCINSFVDVPPDEQSLLNMLDEDSLLIILSTTGRYRSFNEITAKSNGRGADVVIISEEFNPNLMENNSRYIFLSRHNQSNLLEPHEKTRTTFFIFFEEVIKRIILNKKNI